MTHDAIDATDDAATVDVVVSWAPCGQSVHWCGRTVAIDAIARPFEAAVRTPAGERVGTLVGIAADHSGAPAADPIYRYLHCTSHPGLAEFGNAHDAVFDARGGRRRPKTDGDVHIHLLDVSIAVEHRGRGHGPAAIAALAARIGNGRATVVTTCVNPPDADAKMLAAIGSHYLAAGFAAIDVATPARERSDGPRRTREARPFCLEDGRWLVRDFPRI